MQQTIHILVVMYIRQLGVQFKMGKKAKEHWIIVTNKKTYLLLIAALLCFLYPLGEAIFIFGFKKGDVSDLIASFGICIIIAVIFIYLFIRANTYSHLFNPEHPKPDSCNSQENASISDKK